MKNIRKTLQTLALLILALCLGYCTFAQSADDEDLLELIDLKVEDAHAKNQSFVINDIDITQDADKITVVIDYNQQHEDHVVDIVFVNGLRKRFNALASTQDLTLALESKMTVRAVEIWTTDEKFVFRKPVIY